MDRPASSPPFHHPNLLVAITWQTIAELWRRVGVRYRLALEEVHPGISMRGLMWLHVDVVGRSGLRLEFNLGGPQPGTVTLHEHGGYEPTWRVDLVQTVLNQGNAAAVDALIEALRLPELPKGPPPPQTAALRLIAQVLALQAQRRMTVWPTLGFVASIGSPYPKWLVRWDLELPRDPFSPADQNPFNPSGALAIAGSYVSLHQCEPGAACPLMQSSGDNGTAVSLHLPSGRLRFLWRERVAGEVALHKLYRSGGWGLAGVAERVVKYLSK